MRYVVGYVPDESGLDALALARLLAGSAEPPELIACTVLPQTGVVAQSSSPGQSGYVNLLRERVQAEQEVARDALRGVPTQFVIRQADSAAVGLFELADEVDASLIILGSSRSGVFGRYVVGSVAGALQHASRVPLAFAPDGFAGTDLDRPTRISCGYAGSADAATVVDAAVQLCRSYQAPLRLLTFVFPDYPYLQSLSVTQQPVGLEEVQAAEERLSKVQGSLPDDLTVEAQVARGANLAQAVARPGWHPGEILVLGSARLGALSRVFLGPTSLKLLRTCPAPVLAVPRGAEVRLDPDETSSRTD